ncbi:amino acid permease [Arsenicicoccus sp. oral taxon 190]|uniref:amino acid permease n=1 Tax=Arsenicicoccus sp. oral taxon 190 TaxID=1658671 RepID=UPI00067A336B|nr:amino acid permease [Arsenicicoccus sp. oral taxon 190]AKT51246.1 hypothetical protein ADJ73_07845 [Arsenicicoccus sp. oral taxon 190]
MTTTTDPVVDAPALPESLPYRLKTRLLGRPLNTAEAEHERLGNGLALGVLSSDCISSSAYGSEEMLLVLLPVLGLMAYDALLPLTGVVLLVLLIVTLAYRQVVMIYTKAGGSYVVARDNFGPVVAQVGAVALMLDYIVTVAVQAAAGTAALTSAVPALLPASLWITVVVVCGLAYGNLRGLREAGRAFAFPTYFFVGAMAVVIVTGIVREVLGDLPHYDPVAAQAHGGLEIGHGSAALSIGVVYILMKSFANGGSSLTGLEAISNGVSTFTAPAGRNARRTLVVMSCLLAGLVGGVSWLAHETHAVVYAAGSPTVISQVARAVFPDNGFGHVLFLVVQLATMLILYTGANTPFNGFPYLANFVAEDGFLPRWLQKRGHRLAFSNGIVLLTVVALALILVTGAHVDKLVAFYAIGVFTGFTLAGFGMAAHYRRADPLDEPHRTRNIVLNTATGVVSLVVVVVFAVTKFTEGAWLVVVVFPIMVLGLLRLHREYTREAQILATHPVAQPVRIAPTSIVVVLVDTVDLALVRALRYARTLKPAQLRCVHLVVDTAHAERLQQAWDQLETRDLALELVDCPDRRLDRTAMLYTHRLVERYPTAQVTVLLPRRTYGAVLGRLLHDKTADRLAAAVSRVHGVAATIVPFDASASQRQAPASEHPGPLQPAIDPLAPVPPQVWEPQDRAADLAAVPSAAGVIDIGAARPREVVTVRGRVESMRVSALASSPALVCELTDGTGRISVQFYGRRLVAGIHPGTAMEVTGRVARSQGETVIANPTYELVTPALTGPR